MKSQLTYICWAAHAFLSTFALRMQAGPGQATPMTMATKATASAIRVDGNLYSLDAEFTHSDTPEFNHSDTPSFEPDVCTKLQKEKQLGGHHDYGKLKGYGMFEHHGCCNTGKYNRVYPTAGWSMKKLLEKWADKTVGFFGDSSTKQNIDAIALGLEELGVSWKRVSWKTFRIPQYNITIERNCETGHRGGNLPGCGVISPLPGRMDRALETCGKRCHNIKNITTLSRSTYPTTFELFESSLQTADIFYINVGVHMSQEEPEELKVAEFEYIKHKLESLLKEKPQNQYFVRLTSPQHFVGKDNSGVSYEHSNGTDCAGYGVPTEEHHTSKLARELFKGSPVKVLDYYNLLSKRGDLHLRDCTHNCYNHQMYKAQFALMEAALN